MKLYTVTYKKSSWGRKEDTGTILIAANTMHQVNEDFRKFQNKSRTGEIREVSILFDDIRVAKK